MLNVKCIYVYTIVTSIIATCIFLYGYIPVDSSKFDPASMTDLPTKIGNISVNPNDLYKPHVTKVVLVFLESLKMDFLKEKSRSNLSYIHKLINSGKACILPYVATAPATSIQKIKNLATGRSSNFMEEMLMFGNAKLEIDNIFESTRKKNLKISLSGIDTWEQLFPENFIRNKIIRPFNIFDFHEADSNVTSNMYVEMNKNDWNWLILHYIGLKNIGLTHYAYSKIVLEKLHEFDNIIKYIHKSLSSQKEDYMILIIGDKGTGKLNDPTIYSSSPNTIAPYIVIGKPCSRIPFSKAMNNFDMTPTLTALTGILTPTTSYGSIKSELLRNFTVAEELYVLHYNAKRLINNFLKMNIKNNKEDLLATFKEAVSQHVMYLQNSNFTKKTTLSKMIKKMYNTVSHSISQRIHNDFNTSDVAIQYLAFVLIFEAMLILINKSEKIQNLKSNTIITFGVNILILLYVLATGINRRGTSLIHVTKIKGMILAIIILIMICNSYIMARQRCFVILALTAVLNFFLKSKDVIQTVSSTVQPTKHKSMTNCIFIILIMGIILHGFSLLELSYIKNEKWLWFFLWCTLCLWIIYNRVQKACCEPATIITKSDKTQSNYGGEISIVISILIMHRAIMTYSVMEQSISHSDNLLCASLCLVFGLMLLAFTCSIYHEPFTSNLEKAVICVHLIVVCLTIYACNIAKGNVVLFFYPKSCGTVEMILFWVSWIFGLVYGLIIYGIRTLYSGAIDAKKLLAHGISFWALFSALLTRPHKVMLIPIQMLYSQVLGDIFKKHDQSYILSHIWLGYLFFYYQGYTYSLDSIDRAAGLIALQYTSLILTRIFVIVNTFSAPILSYFICIYGIYAKNTTRSVTQNTLLVNKLYACCRLFSISIYTLSMLIHRHNVWLWTILSPKLLYEVVHTFLLFTVTINSQVFAFLHDSIKAPVSEMNNL